jgi:predicted nucleic acid-binding protein
MTASSRIASVRSGELAPRCLQLPRAVTARSDPAAEFALWLSPHILSNVDRILTQLFKWEADRAEQYIGTLVSAAKHSGGGVVDEVPHVVGECQDYQDNLILDLAVEVGAFLVVSNDTDLLAMSPWRGTPIIEPKAFSSKVDAMRRHSRHRRLSLTTWPDPTAARTCPPCP